MKKIFILFSGLFLASCDKDALIPVGTGNGATVEITGISSVGFNSAIVGLSVNYPAGRTLKSVGIQSNSFTSTQAVTNAPVLNGTKQTLSVNISLSNLSPNQNYIVKPFAEFSVEESILNIKFLGIEKPIVTKKIFIENGIIKCPTAIIGDNTILEGKKIEVVDRNLLIKRRDEKADLTCLCTTMVTDMSELFADNFPEFNQNISNWDLSNVTSTRDMFRKAFAFNQPIGNWDVSQVTDMAGMFFFAEKFDQSLVNWNVSNVKKMHYMFREAKIFNGDISRWNVSKVDNFYSMFLNAWLFNRDISSWNTKSAIDLGDMFWWAKSFNQPLGNWDLSSANNLAGMFNGAISFNQDISKWNTSNVNRMDYMFTNAYVFNKDIGNWDVSKVNFMDYMFFNAQNFNQNLKNWCTKLIKSEPINFSQSSPLNNKPYWGFCQPFNTVVSKTGRIWMDRNLGASQVATSPTDALAYGDLYQWGRGTDGHQIRTSGTTTNLSQTDQPRDNLFILNVNIVNGQDWRVIQNNNLWQSVNGVNNPCPAGFRIPTAAEWNSELSAYPNNNLPSSPLKLPNAGGRSYQSGSLDGVGSFGYYWSSTVNGTNAITLYFNQSTATLNNNYRAFGFCVRCIKD